MIKKISFSKENFNFLFLFWPTKYPVLCYHLNDTLKKDFLRVTFFFKLRTKTQTRPHSLKFVKTDSSNSEDKKKRIFRRTTNLKKKLPEISKDASALGEIEIKKNKRRKI